MVAGWRCGGNYSLASASGPGVQCSARRSSTTTRPPHLPTTPPSPCPPHPSSSLLSRDAERTGLIYCRLPDTRTVLCRCRHLGVTSPLSSSGRCHGSQEMSAKLSELSFLGTPDNATLLPMGLRPATTQYDASRDTSIVVRNANQLENMPLHFEKQHSEWPRIFERNVNCQDRKARAICAR